MPSAPFQNTAWSVREPVATVIADGAEDMPETRGMATGPFHPVLEFHHISSRPPPSDSQKRTWLPSVTMTEGRDARVTPPLAGTGPFHPEPGSHHISWRTPSVPFQKTICWSREVSATDGAEAIGAPPVTRPAPVQPVPLFHASQRLLSVPFHQIAW